MLKIFKDSEMNETKRQNHKRLLDIVTFDFKFREPGEVNEDLLRFPIDYLNSVGMKAILLTDVEMSKYCDCITRDGVDSKDFGVISQMFESIKELDINDKSKYNEMNSVSLGNIAYLMLNTDNKVVEIQCEQLLNDILNKEYLERFKEVSHLLEGDKLELVHKLLQLTKKMDNNQVKMLSSIIDNFVSNIQ